MFTGLADEIGSTAQSLGVEIDGDDAASQETIRNLGKAGFSNDQINNF